MRPIDADIIMADLNDHADYADMLIKDIKEYIAEQPTIDAEPVRHGKWEVIDEAEPRRYGCDVCKCLSWHTYNYCPNCGAKMDGGVE